MEQVSVERADALRAAGLRVTRSRDAVLGALETHPHATAATVIDAVRATGASVSTQAVYDVLHALVDAGLARRFEPQGSAARYERRVGDNHHHLICRVCGAVEDVDCAHGSAPCLTPAAGHGFVVDEAEITYWGVCGSCARPDHHQEDA